MQAPKTLDQDIVRSKQHKSQASSGESHANSTQKHDPMIPFFNYHFQNVEDIMDSMQMEDFEGIENLWEKRFYRSELKVAMFLNYSLMKLIGQRDQQIKNLKQQRGRPTEENDKNLLNNTKLKSQNLTFGSLKASRQGQRSASRFQQLASNKTYHDDKTKAYQEENQYLRNELYKVGQAALKLKETISKLEQQQAFNLQKDQEMKQELTRLNFALKQAQDNANHWQCESLSIALKKKQYESQLQDLCLNLASLRKQLKQKIQQVGQYRSVVEEVKQISKTSRNYKSERQKLLTQIEILKKELFETKKRDQIGEINKNSSIRSSRKIVQEKECSECQNLLKAKNQLEQELRKCRTYLFQMREKLDQTLQFQMVQKRQWQNFLKQIDSND